MHDASKSCGPVVLCIALVLSLTSYGCSTTYQPRDPGRVSLVIHHGAALYVRNGVEQPVGPFSGELEGLVADVPAAAEHARTAHTQFIVGVPAYLTGAAGIVVSVVVLAGPIGWVVIGAGAAVAGTGLVFMGTGLTHAIDAVNIHNQQIRP